MGFEPLANAAETFHVTSREVADTKAVFATVESINEVPARARIGGTVTELTVDEGASVKGGERVAMIVDDKLSLQLKALEAQIAALQSQVQLNQTELERSRTLFEAGTIPKARLDQVQTNVDLALGELRARTADQAVLAQQLAEGEVLAPTAGRVISVPVTKGEVVLAGETVATVATENFILRLKLPERHARFIAEGDSIALAGGELTAAKLTRGKITKVYPLIENGRVVADAQVEGLGDFFVGERVRVLLATGARKAIAVPLAYVFNRSGVDYVNVEGAGAVAVQRGREFKADDDTPLIEILTGISDGDTLVHP
jgi:RND family efflux transporter MFP subunit